MLWILGCPGVAWGSLGASIWGARARIPPVAAAAAAEVRGTVTAPGVTVGCGADSVIVVGGSALMMCVPELMATELEGWPLFKSGVCMPIPVWLDALAATEALALLFPFKTAPDPTVCIGVLTSVTVGPVAWLIGWAEATTLWEFMSGVWITLFEEGGIVTPASPFDNTGPLLTAVTDIAALLLLPVPLVTIVPLRVAAFPELWEFIVWLPLKVCAEYEPTFPWWLGRKVTPLLTTGVLPGSCPVLESVLESVLAVDASIAEPWGARYVETPRTSTCLTRRTNNLECNGARLCHSCCFSLSAPAIAFRLQ